MSQCVTFGLPLWYEFPAVAYDDFRVGSTLVIHRKVLYLPYQVLPHQRVAEHHVHTTI